MKRIGRHSVKSLAMLALTFLVCLVAMAAPAFAADETSGYVGGSSVTWFFDEETGALYIGGEGEAPAFESREDQPWADFREEITEVWYLDMGSIYIPDMSYWFDGCVNLVSAEIPYTAEYIGPAAFGECHSLSSLTFYYFDSDPYYFSDDFMSGTEAQNPVICIFSIFEQTETLETLRRLSWSTAGYGAVRLVDVYVGSTLKVEVCSKSTCDCTGGTYSYGKVSGQSYHTVTFQCNGSVSTTTALGTSSCNDDDTGYCNSTCTTQGYNYKRCSYCKGNFSYVGEKWALLDHNSDGNTVTTAATCTTAGEGYTYCTMCKGNKKTYTIAASHSLTGEVYSNATHTSSGHEQIQYCSSCKKNIGLGTYVWKDHGPGTTGSGSCKSCGTCTWTTDTSKTSVAATCTTTGTAYYVCKCGDTKSETVAKLGHDCSYGIWREYDATQHRRIWSCDRTGCSYGYYVYEDHYDDNSDEKCDVCEYAMASCKHTNQTTTHTYVDDSTHTTTVTCNDCEATVSSDTVSHVDSNSDCKCDDCKGTYHSSTTTKYTYTNSSTHTKTKSCTVCSTSIESSSESHSIKTTYTDNGDGSTHTIAKKCTLCDHSFTSSSDSHADANGDCSCDKCLASMHTLKVSSYKEATCTTSGYKTYLCTVCGEKVEERYEALGHSYATVVTAATCTTAETFTNTCGRCGDVSVTYGAAAKGHTQNTIFSLSAHPHQKYYTCTVCSETIYINAFATYTHGDGASGSGTCPSCGSCSFTTLVASVAATCTTTGSQTYECACGKEKTTAVAATGHSYGSTQYETAHPHAEYKVCSSCDAKEYTGTYKTLTHGDGSSGTCSACGTCSYTTQIAYTAATCTTDGSETTKCACGNVQTTYTAATGHSFGTATYAAADHPHAQYKLCSVCKATEYTGTYVTKAHGDGATGSGTCPSCGDCSFTTQTAYTAPTCTTAGSQTYQCACGKTQTEVLAATGHSASSNYTYYDITSHTTTATCSACSTTISSSKENHVDSNTNGYCDLCDGALSYTITWDANGGQPSATTTQTFGKTLSIPSSPYFEGYAFLGWYTSKTGSALSAVDSSTVYTTAGDTTYYARWVIKSYSVKWDAGTNGGTIEGESYVTTSMRGYGVATPPSDTPVKEGYTFKGWYSSASGGTSYEGVYCTGETTFYAVFESEANATYSIIWNASANGGTIDGESSVITTQSGSGVATPPSSTPEKEGYTFTGWYSAATGGSLYNTITCTETTTFYAQFSVITYEITWDASSNGGTINGGNSVKTSMSGAGIATPPNYVPAKSGYVFTGWFTAKTGGYEYDTVTCSSDRTFYAQFTESGNSSSSAVGYDPVVVVYKSTGQMTFYSREVIDLSEETTGCYIYISENCTSTIIPSSGTDNTVTISASIDTAVYDSATSRPWNSICTNIKYVTFADEISPVSTAYWFSGCTALVSFNGTNLSTSSVKTMSYMFSGCTALASVNVIGFDTSSVETMTGMFLGCTRLTGLDLSTFSTESLTNTSRMFYGCTNIVTIYASSSETAYWDNSGITSANSVGMFYNCTKLVGGNGTSFTSSVINASYAWIDGLGGAKGYFTESTGSRFAVLYEDGVLVFYNRDDDIPHTGDIYDRGVVSAVYTGFATDTYTSYTSVPWLQESITACMKIRRVYFADYIAPVSTAYWFYNCQKMTEFNATNLDTCNVIHSAYMFYKCSSLTELDLTGFETSSIINMNYMFAGCTGLGVIYASALWSTDSVTAGNYVFSGCLYLYGGNGSCYAQLQDYSYAYARIDAPGIKGYLTEFVHLYIEYDGNNSDNGSMDSQYIYYCPIDDTLESTYLKTNAYSRTNYTFLGWGESSDDTVPAYSDGQSVSTLSSLYPGSTTTLYAIWEPIATSENTVCEHTMAKTESVAATCTSAGYEIYTCSKGCGYAYQNSISATGHNYTTVTTSATCTTDGYTMETCQACGSTTIISTTSATGHKQGTIYAGSVHPHAQYYVCSACSETIYTGTYATKSHGDGATGSGTCPSCGSCSFTTQISYNAPTCTANGSATYQCACGATKTIVLATTGHSYSTTRYADSAHPHAIYLVCSSCGDKSYTGDYQVKAHGSGATGTNTCKYCGSCTFVQDTYVAPSCTSAGYVLYTCDCGAKTTTTIPATGHSYSTTTYADSAHPHAVYQVCSVCGSFNYTGDYVTKTHGSGAAGTGTCADCGSCTFTQSAYSAPTCTSVGYVTYSCDCGITTTETVPATGHSTTIVYVNYSAAAHTVSSVCSTCSKTVSSYYESHVNTNSDGYCDKCGAALYFTLTVKAGTGASTSGSSASGSYAYGTSITLTGSAKTGYTWSGWTSSNTSAQSNTSNASVTFTMPAADLTMTANATPNTYTVKYNANGGSGTMADQTHTYGSFLALRSNTFERPGYTFLGWAKESTAESASYEDGVRVINLASSGSVTLYAVWEANAYTITWNSQGGSSVASTVQIYNTSIALPSAPTKAGYKFEGWYTAASGGTQITSSTQYNTVGDSTFYAQWSVLSYDITWNSNGGSPSTQTTTQTYNEAITLPSEPTKTSYIFTGWFTAATNGTQITETTLYQTANTATYYAHWKLNTYEVVWDGNDGSPEYQTTTQTYDANIVFPATESPSRDGYTFVGWFTEQSAGTQITTSIKYQTKASSTYYAHWTANSYTITWNSQGGTTISNTSQTYDTNLKLPTEPTRDGYDFAGWYTSATGGSEVTGETVYQIAGNTTYYARWYPNVYTITWDSQGGSTVGTTTQIFGETLNMPATPTRGGYTFDGWFTSLTGGTQLSESTVYETSNDSTYYAHWTANTYTVKFDGNGNTSGTMSDQVHTYDTALALTKNAFNKTGYTFMGWALSSDADSALYTDMESVMNIATTGSIVLYAVWDAQNYTVVFNSNGGFGSMDSDTFIFDEEQALSRNAFYRFGFNFLGWSTSSTATTATYTDMQSVKNLATSGSTTLYAVWGQNSYSLSYDYSTGSVSSANKTSYNVATSTFSLTNPTLTGYTLTKWTEVIQTSNWTDGFINMSSGVIEYSSTYPNSVFSELIYLKSGVTYTISGITSSGIRWRWFNTSGTYQGSVSGDTFTPSSNCYARILLYEGCGSTERNAMKITSTVSSTAPSTPTMSITKGSTGNRSYTANWTANIYYVAFNANGGTGTMDTQTHTYNTSLALTEKAFTRPGYRFLGWSTSSTATTAAYTDKESVKNLTSTYGDTVTLYAVWENKNSCTITTHPSNQTVTYPDAATLSVVATGLTDGSVSSVLTYQWQKSSNGSSWTNISGATGSSYTTPEAMTAGGNYYYRVVVTSTFGVSGEDGYQVTATSNSAKVTVKKSAATFTLTDPTDSTTSFSSGQKWIFKAESKSYTVAKVTHSNTDSNATITVKTSSNLIGATLSGGQLVLTPTTTETGTTGVKITISVAATDNFEAGTFTAYAYSSDGPEFSNPDTGVVNKPLLAPSTATNTDVVATFKIHDYMSEVDSNYKVEKVIAYEVTADGRTEMAVKSLGSEKYSMTIEANGVYGMEATDTLGNVVKCEFTIDYIDKTPPVINDVGGVSYNTSNGKISVLILAEDNVSPASDLRYCWDYTEGSSSNVWTTSCYMDCTLYDEITVAVMDAVGNINAQDFKVTLAAFDTNTTPGTGEVKVLDYVYNDISGTIFGEDKYLQGETISNYTDDGYVFIFHVTPSVDDYYIAGYLTLNGAKFEVKWFEDKECTIPISGDAVNKPAYGRVILDPDDFTAAGTQRNASADLVLTQYSDETMEGKVSTEKYSMACSIDITPPVIQASYDAYSRDIHLTVKDAISGISEDVAYVVESTTGTCSPIATIKYPTVETDDDEFIITFTAKDKLGNTATKSFTFDPNDYVDPNAGGTGGGTGSDSGSGTSDVNLYGYKTRLFTIYIVNGSRSNTTNGTITG